MSKINSKLFTLMCMGAGSFALALLLTTTAYRADAQQRALTGNENHVVSLDEAVKYITNFTSKPDVPTIKGGYFGRNIFDKLLSQTGCVGIRYYYAKTDSGVATIVLVGVDGAGNDLYQGVLAEEAIPCPPICSASNPLNKQ